MSLRACRRKMQRLRDARRILFAIYWHIMCLLVTVRRGSGEGGQDIGGGDTWPPSVSRSMSHGCRQSH